MCFSGSRKSLSGYGFPCRTGDDAENGMQLSAPKGGSFLCCKVNKKSGDVFPVCLENKGIINFNQFPVMDSGKSQWP